MSKFIETIILKIKGDWREVVNDCRYTVGKEDLVDGKEPTDDFKVRILISEHSPIRDISVKWRWYDIKSWIATHWSRHMWECFIKTQRTDRTGINRDKLPQDQLVNFTGDANAQHLIDTWRKRLCMQASSETREYAEVFKAHIRTIPELKQISDVLVPNCIYRNGCPEMDECPRWQGFVKYCRDNADQHPGLMSIRQRYAWYNEWFYKVLRKENDHE